MQPLIAMRFPFSTLGTQPMNYEAASSAAAASAIRPCAVPDSSALPPQLQDAYFHDSYRFPVDDPHWPALGLFLRAASQTPQWVERLMGLRNSIVALVGLKNLGGLRGVDQNKPLAAYRPGQRVGIFTLISVSDDEVLVGDRDRHLDVVVSVLRLPWDGRGQREAVVSTRGFQRRRQTQRRCRARSPLWRCWPQHVLGHELKARPKWRNRLRRWCSASSRFPCMIRN